MLSARCRGPGTSHGSVKLLANGSDRTWTGIAEAVAAERAPELGLGEWRGPLFADSNAITHAVAHRSEPSQRGRIDPCRRGP